jgi:hypothetical protein
MHACHPTVCESKKFKITAGWRKLHTGAPEFAVITKHHYEQREWR